MKKTLVALAVLAASGASFAQVTLSGGYGIGVTSNGTATTVGQTDGSFNLAVNEDLGGGLKVAVSQTVAFGTHGTNTTADGGSLALSGGFGALKYGNTCAGRALGEAVVGGAYTFAHAVGGANGDCRADYQYVLYTLPSFVSGLTVAARIQNNATGTAIAADGFSAADNGAQLRLNYNVGQLTSGFYARSNSSELHLAYDLGVAAVKFGTDTKVASGDKRTEFGVSVPMGNLSLGLGYGKKGAIKGTEVGATYALSKRSSVVATYGSFDGATQDTSTRVKLMHSF